MKPINTRLLFNAFALMGWLGFSSWVIGPYPECKSDSLAIVRIIKPINDMFEVKPVVYISKGLCEIDEVKVTDTQYVDGDLAIRQTLSGLLMNGYTIQTATESFDDGVKLNTYYLKKKAI